MKRMEWAGHGNWLDEGRQEKRHQEWIVFRSAQVCELREPTQVPTAPSHSSQLPEVTHTDLPESFPLEQEKGHGRCLCKCWAASEVLREALKERLLWEPPPHSVAGEGWIQGVIITWERSCWLPQSVLHAPHTSGCCTPLSVLRVHCLPLRPLLHKTTLSPASLPFPSLAWGAKGQPLTLCGALCAPELTWN